MKKDRLLGTLGSDQAMWKNTSSYAPLATALSRGWDTTPVLLAARALAASTASNTSVFPSYVGQEIFESSERPRPYFNNCWHVRSQAVTSVYTAAFKNGTSAYLYPYMRTAAPTDAVPLAQLFRHYTAELRPAQRSAWATMQPRFEGDVNLFVFLAELKDFRSLAKIMANRPLLKLSNYLRSIRSKIRKRGLLFDPSRPLSELHLTSEFAIKPLLSDLMEISCQIETIAAEAQQQFSDAGRELSSRHYTEELYRNDVDTRSAYYQTKYPFWLSGTSRTLTFTATMEYSYEYNCRQPLDAFMRYWGLVPNAEAIWELIPFSFLLDYFVKIGRSLRVARRDSNVCLNLNQYCESLLSNFSSGLHFKDSHLLHPVIHGTKEFGTLPRTYRNNNLVSGYISSLYTRRNATPNKGSVLPRIARPSTQQQLNMLALARCFL